MDKYREILNVVVLTLLFLSIGVISKKELPSSALFSEANMIKEAMIEDKGDIYYRVTASIYRIVEGEFEPEKLIETLGLLSLVFGVFTVILFYLVVRSYGFDPNSSLFGTMLFLTSPAAFFAFAPPHYSRYTFGLFLCVAGMAAFSLLRYKKSLFLVGCVLFVLAAVVSSDFATTAIGIAMALGFEAGRNRNEKRLGAFVIPAVLLALTIPFVFLEAEKFYLSLNLSSFKNSLFDFRFLIPLGAISLIAFGRRFEKEGDAFILLLFILGTVISFLTTYASLPLIALCTTAGISWLLSEEKREVKELLAGYGSFFFFLSLSFSGFSEVVSAMVLSITSLILFSAILYIYKFRIVWLAPLLVSFLTLSSVAGGILLSSSTSANGEEIGGRYVGGIGGDEYNAYVWINKNVEKDAKIAVLWNEEAARFLTERKVEGLNRAFLRFLAGNESIDELKKEGFGYIVVSSDIFDFSRRFRDVSGSTFRAESFSFFANITSNGGKAALFKSSEGRYISRRIDPDGTFPIEDAVYFDSFGVPIGTIPYSSILALDESLPFYHPKQRMVWVQGIYDTNAFKLFFDEIDGVKKIYGNSQVRVFRLG
ncbi:MAG: hypothetical protein QXW70_04070 [Candidatus Anstonellales archaeon]